MKSFVEDTYLVDRRTCLKAYLDAHPEVFESRPPPDLEARFSG